jgi:hypothetical protein
VTLEFAFDDKLSHLVREYLFDHRPVLQRGVNEPWLFPGTGGRHKAPISSADRSLGPSTRVRAFA